MRNKHIKFAYIVYSFFKLYHPAWLARSRIISLPVQPGVQAGVPRPPPCHRAWPAPSASCPPVAGVSGSLSPSLEASCTSRSPGTPSWGGLTAGEVVAIVDAQAFGVGHELGKGDAASFTRAR